MGRRFDGLLSSELLRGLLKSISSSFRSFITAQAGRPSAGLTGLGQNASSQRKLVWIDVQVRALHLGLLHFCARNGIASLLCTV